MSGVSLGARFSLATNRLRYCGPEDAEPLLVRAITQGRDLDGARATLRKFEALEPYLAAIAEKHGRDLFDEEVVEAYWIGNDLLDDFTKQDFRGILKRLGTRGLPPAIAKRLETSLPNHPVPHHAFHVTFVGVGAVTGKVETTLENMENCRPSWAFVHRFDATSVQVEKPVLRLDRGRFRIDGHEMLRLRYDPQLLNGLRPTDALAMHWRQPVMVLSPGQLVRLQTYTERSLEASSEALAALRLV